MVVFTHIMGYLAGALNLLPVIPYVLGMRHGSVKPHRVTWFALTILQLLMAVSYYRASGGSSAVWMNVASFVGTSIVAAFSVRYGVGGTEKHDVRVIALVACALVAWFVSSDPRWTLGLGIATGAVAFIPTFEKTFRAPTSESAAAWGICFTASVVNFLAIEDDSLVVVSQPLYFYFISGALAYMTFQGWRQSRAAPRLG